MRRRAAQSPEEDRGQMTPMIDVTFLLLVFFMCTLRFKTLEGKLAAYLPRDVGRNAASADPAEVIQLELTVLREGTRLDPSGTGPWSESSGARFVYGADRLLRYRVGPTVTTDPSNLARRLRALNAADPERPLAVDARPGTVYEDVVRVVDLALGAGVEEIRFVGAER